MFDPNILDMMLAEFVKNFLVADSSEVRDVRVISGS